ncbi:MAG: Crp/Fnr family transcriptional regulator [Armatimonadota bacterium]|nr:Crp/Fnr family transcriptional regulator [Armatimonadota bacterium]MDR7425754.1 Crp/Fnr family transcriptional regulator [Armatimonadota bacterium]MDR7442910.1 Crp/Fnr family transcriptional regulator [Armatimonadota bacterium]
MVRLRQLGGASGGGGWVVAEQAGSAQSSGTGVPQGRDPGPLPGFPIRPAGGTGVVGVDAVLSGIPLFAGCPAEALVALASGAQRRRYRRGEALFREGDPATGVFVLERGWVRVRCTSVDGRERTLALLGPGELLGEVAALEGGVRSADAVVQEDCVLVFLPREGWVDWLRRRPEVALRLVQLLGQRLRAADLQIRDSAFLGVGGRLARVLLQLGAQRGESRADGGVLCPRLRQVELAQMVGATRESVNKWLRRLERAGAVRRSGDRITVLDPERLRREIG